MHRSSWFSRFIIVIVVAALAGLLAWQTREGGTDDFPAPPPVLAPPNPQAAAPLSGAAPLPPVSPADASLAEQVQALMGTGDPAKAFLAYRLVQGCAQFNTLHDRLIFDEAELNNWKGEDLPGYRSMSEGEKQRATLVCRDMSERQRVARLDYLAIAARAGIPGAAVAFAEEGPFGDRTALATRPQDLLVQEWKSTAIAQLTMAAESGSDLGALAYLASAYGGGSALTEPNPLLAYRYRTAASLIDARMSAPTGTPGKTFEEGAARWDAMVREFAPERRAAELAAARDIAARAVERLRPALASP